MILISRFLVLRLLVRWLLIFLLLLWCLNGLEPVIWMGFSRMIVAFETVIETPRTVTIQAFITCAVDVLTSLELFRGRRLLKAHLPYRSHRNNSRRAYDRVSPQLDSRQLGYHERPTKVASRFDRGKWQRCEVSNRPWP